MQEIWKDIVGYGGKYQVSTWGNIRNDKGIIMKPYINEKGYLKVTLRKNGKKKNERISRLVAETFIPNPFDMPEVNHKDGNKNNNSVTNLEWCTGEQNKEHYMKIKNGESYF